MKDSLWDDMKRMREEMDSLFDNFFYSEPQLLLGGPSKGNSMITKERYRAPVFDISETDKDYKISLEIPGSKKEDIKVNITDNNLEIKAEHKKEEKKEDKEKGYYSYSKSYAGYYRSFALPRNIDANKISAEYKDGVLHLSIPKKEIAGTPQKLIEVK